jgi:hypothetical protein
MKIWLLNPNGNIRDIREMHDKVEKYKESVK